MRLEILWPDKAGGFDNLWWFKQFVQRMADRLVVGMFRYGKAARSKKYLTRLQLEVDAYRASGNTEHLINAANYCVLESVTPEHPNSHFKHMRSSVTRGKV